MLRDGHPRVGMLASFLAVFAMLALATSASAAVYNVTEIGTFGGSYSEANAINRFGEVAGTAGIAGQCGGVRAFRYAQGVLIDLGEPPVEPVPGFPGEPFRCPNGLVRDSFGLAINSLGDVAGSSIVNREAGAGFGKVFEPNGTPRTVGIASEIGFGAATGINDEGEVAGRGRQVAWVENRQGVVTTLGLESLGFDSGYGQANAINDRGEVVGGTQGPGLFAQVAFLYSHGALYELGTLAGDSGEQEAEATAINERGDVIVGDSRVPVPTNCGFFGPPCQEHAFSYSHGEMTDLGTLPGTDESAAYGVNDLGLIVGSSGGRAFVDFSGSMIDLNTLIPPDSGWTLARASGINDLGEIVGTGLHNGVERGFVLTPKWGLPF